MLTPSQFRALLSPPHPSHLTLDAALATHLETQGHNLTHPLWSGLILQTSPSSIKSLHLDYYRAGAEVAITASYQTSTAGLTKHLNLSEAQGKALIAESARLALEAREIARGELAAAAAATTSGARGGGGEGGRLLVAGSVGPYGAFLADGSEYTGSYSLSPEAFKAFHRPRMQALVDGGVDLLALETMPSFAEIQALVALLAEEFPQAVAWVSCTLHPDGGGRIADGTLLARVVEEVGRGGQVVAVGVNCCGLGLAVEALASVGVGEGGLPLVCYPNSGEEWDGVNKVWKTGEAGEAGGLTRERVEAFVAAGARLVGGCCRTGPGDVGVVRRTLEGLAER